MLSPTRLDIGIGTKAATPMLSANLPIVGDYDVIPGLIVADQIHFIDREHQAFDADKMREIAVPPSLRQNSLSRIDQDDGKIGARRSRDHVARVLLMARGIRDNEFTAIRRKEAVGHINRDSLLAHGGQAIHQQREVDILTLGADAPAVGGERGKLVLEYHLAVVEKPADESRLAVIDRAAGNETQQCLVLMLNQVCVDVLGNEFIGLIRRVRARRRHQKYPACFFVSIDAA